MNPLPSLRAADLSAAPLDTFWLDLASGAAPHRGHLIRLAGVAEDYATQPPGSGYGRVAGARDEDGIILVSCRRFRAAAGTTSTRPTSVLSHQRQQADALCEPDGESRQQLCGNLPEPWSRHRTAHQDDGDARRRLSAWRAAAPDLIERTDGDGNLCASQTRVCDHRTHRNSERYGQP